MSVRKTTITVASAACLAIACPAVKKYEGYAPTVVPDRLANGLPTGGYGETEGVKLGETHAEKFWSDRLSARLKDEYDAGLGQCIHVELPDGVRAYAISTSYNAGVSAVCHSPMVAKWNAGDIVGGCLAIKGWRVGSHPHGPNGPLVVQRGLVNRRNDESAKCVGYANGTLKPPALPAALVPADEPAPLPAPEKPAPKKIAHRVAAAKPAAPSSCFLPWVFKCKS